MKLYTYFRSSAAYRVRIALNLKNLPYDAIAVPLRSYAHKQPDYLKKNPQGLVPLLEDGGKFFSQSLAILEYLEETHPEPALLPKGAAARAHVRAMAMVIACDIHPINNLRVLKYLKGEMGQAQEQIDLWYRHWIIEGFKTLEALVQPEPTGPAYCYGDHISFADLCLIPQMFNARRFNTDLSAFPKLTAIDSQLLQHPAVVAASPEAQFDAD